MITSDGRTREKEDEVRGVHFDPRASDWTRDMIREKRRKGVSRGKDVACLHSLAFIG